MTAARQWESHPLSHESVATFCHVVPSSTVCMSIISSSIDKFRVRYLIDCVRDGTDSECEWTGEAEGEWSSQPSDIRAVTEWRRG